MTSEERREAIIKAALPVFAHQGPANTTTREVAAAAGVSEALLYKHFSSKESLFEEIQHFGCQGNNAALDRIVALKSSTATLVHIVYFLMRSLSMVKSDDLVDWESRHRLTLNSCLDDGAFLRYLFENHIACCVPKLEACLETAAAAGDLVEVPVSRPNRLLFAHHLACMIGFMHLPQKPALDYQASREELLHQAVWFVLRGMGLKDKAIATYFNPKAMALFWEAGLMKKAI